MEQLIQTIAGQDLVYANLAGGDIDGQAANIVKAMNAAGVRRLIFVASLGISKALLPNNSWFTRHPETGRNGT